MDSDRQLKTLWFNLRARCKAGSPRGYLRSDGEPVRLFQQWNDDFLSFIADVGEPPAPGYRLTRVIPDLGFIPGNVRWAQPNNAAAKIVRKPAAPKPKKPKRFPKELAAITFNWAGWMMRYYPAGMKNEF